MTLALLERPELTKQDCSFQNDEQVIADWLADKSKHTVKSYYRTYRQFQNLLCHSQGLDGDKPLTAIDKGDVRLFIIYCQERGNKVSTINTKIAVLRSLFTHLINEEYRDTNPTKGIKNQKQQQDNKKSQTKDVKERVIAPSAISKILENASTQRDRALFELLYFTGMRMHEALNLTWDDFYHDGNNWWIKILGKGGKTRHNKISNDLYNKLQSMQTKNYLFLSNQNKKLSPSACHKQLKVAARKAGLSQDISCHDFRHSHASHALENGASLVSVRDQLGHVSIRTTSQYLHSKESSSDFLSL
jgi:integrase/recombinase XerD